MATKRLIRVVQVLAREYPYRVEQRQVKQLRRILNVLPTTRPRHRGSQDRMIAAIVALPYRL